MVKIKLLPLLLLPLYILAVSGCSELHVIGKATVRELSSDAINVEQASYRPPEQIVDPSKITVAKAAPAKAKKEKKKGLWEH